jgi:hypothetical protein
MRNDSAQSIERDVAATLLFGNPADTLTVLPYFSITYTQEIWAMSV